MKGVDEKMCVVLESDANKHEKTKIYEQRNIDFANLNLKPKNHTPERVENGGC
jgi:hypothetical protein